MMIAVIVPVFNRLSYTSNFISCLQKSRYKQWTLIIVDDGSSDGTGKWLKNISNEIVGNEDITLKPGAIYHITGNGSWWWTKCINVALVHAIKSGADYILTQNNDVEFNESYLERLVETAKKYPSSIITAPIFDLATKKCLIDGAGVIRNWWTAKDVRLPIIPVTYPRDSGLEREENRIRRLPFCSGRGCLIPSEVVKEIGLYDEIHLPQYAADDEYTYRAARKGKAILMDISTCCFTPSQETGITQFLSHRSMKNFIGYLTNIKSPANLSARFWITMRYCVPKWYFPISFSLELGRLCVSFWIKTSKSSDKH